MFSQRSSNIFHALTLSQNEYAQIMHKRVSEEKAKQSEMRKRRASSMRK